MTVAELSCGLPPGPDFADLAVLAEQLGYARVWIYNSAPLWEDPFVHLALAAQRTTRIGLSTAVLVPTERSVMAMAAAIATIARLSNGRFRACFGTGFTARLAVGQPPMTLAALAEYVGSLRQLLAGGPATVDGHQVRMLHHADLAAPRPINVPLRLSVFGPRGTALAGEIADGLIGAPHPTLPAATIISGTVLDPDEDPTSDRVRHAVAPWRVVGWHTAYASGGPTAVDSIPGGRAWRESLESHAPEGERVGWSFEGHVTHLTDRDHLLLDHIDVKAMVGEADRIASRLERLGQAGFAEIVYTPTGPDVARELRAFAAAASLEPGGREIMATPVAQPSSRGSTMRVVVDMKRCESNAICMGIAPDVFFVNDDDLLEVLDETPDESQRPLLAQAVSQCPKQAISIVED